MTGLKKVLGAIAPILVIFGVFALSWVLKKIADTDLQTLLIQWIIPLIIGYLIGVGYSYWQNHRGTP